MIAGSWRCRLSRLARVLSSLACMIVFVRARVNAETATEYEIKAAFLYNFMRFVEWPREAVPDSTAPLVIGILGTDPFGRVLDQILAEAHIENHDIRAVRFQRLADVDSCHVLFVSPTERFALSDILEELGQRPVLTVGETADFAVSGGMIQFVLRDNKVRFEINLTAATQAQLKISSRLLRLAIRVYDEDR
jgi:hypothetical protein